jgi:hypothetical protein
MAIGNLQFKHNFVINIKVSMQMVKKMVMVSINGLMAHNIKAILKMMLNKVKVLFDTKMEKW